MTIAPRIRRNASLIRGLHYFEAVARRLSAKAAAEELGVSQSAVSHQLRELTEALGEQLVFRSGRGIALTATGQQLAERLASAFAGLHDSVEDIVGGGRQTLRLAVCSSFGPGWLIPRISRFMASNPSIDLQLRLYTADPELTGQVADAFVTALPVKPGFDAVTLMDEMLVAVQAPCTAAARQRLITTELDPGAIGRDWINYCAAAGLRLDRLQEGPWLQCTHYLLAIEMARASLGMALAPEFLVKRELESGTLVLFGQHRMASGRVYRLCIKQSRAREPALHALVQWFKGQMNGVTVVPIGRPAARAQNGA